MSSWGHWRRSFGSRRGWWTEGSGCHPTPFPDTTTDDTGLGKVGLTKRFLDEAMERGYSSPMADFVCADCVSNPFLKEVLRSEAFSEAVCDYCDGVGAAPIELVLNEISDAAFSGFTDAANELPYESREGGYLGEILESWDILATIGDWTENERLLEDVAEAFSDVAWCKRDYYSLGEEELLRFGWQAFTRQIKHRTRYLFLQEHGEGEPHHEIPPGRMLAEVDKLLRTLVIPLKKDSKLYRVRIIKRGEELTLPRGLGTPPVTLATVDNRMSPAGIPMFYAAEDMETAVAETFDPGQADDRTLVIGHWRVVRDLTLLDLTDLPEIPDPFDHDNAWQTDRVKFIHAFTQDLTKPVNRNRGSVDYVPTQAVAEHVRWHMRSEDGKRIDGIRYASSQYEGGVAVVVFAQQENCVLPEPDAPPWQQSEQLVELIHVDHRDPSEFTGGMLSLSRYSLFWDSAGIRRTQCVFGSRRRGEGGHPERKSPGASQFLRDTMA